MPSEEDLDNGSSSGETASDSESDNGSEDSVQIETLISGRAKRATAGNRMAQLIEQQEDDEVALLFAEAEGEEDIEFEEEGAEDGSDALMDSDSDDDDQGPNAAADEDLEGEKELQRQAKAERAKKRKAQDALTSLPGLRKKVKIDTTLPTETGAGSAPRPKKKSERVSWLPEPNDAPVRASSRKQTMANKEVTHARLKDHETKRRKLLAQMRKAERDREKSKPKQLTQADRLAEALKVEKKNAKSLNRWEAMEKKRAEEQQAKLDALHNRTLEGPVLTFWSGKAKWIGEKLVTVGSREVKSQPKEYGGEKRGRKKKQVEQPDASVAEPAKLAAVEQPSTDTPVLDTSVTALVTAEPGLEMLTMSQEKPQPAVETKTGLDPIGSTTSKEEPQLELNVATESETNPAPAVVSTSLEEQRPNSNVIASSEATEQQPISTSASQEEAKPKSDEHEGSLPPEVSTTNESRDGAVQEEDINPEKQSSPSTQKDITIDKPTDEQQAAESVPFVSQTTDAQSQVDDAPLENNNKSISTPLEAIQKDDTAMDVDAPESALPNETPTHKDSVAANALPGDTALSTKTPKGAPDQIAQASPPSDEAPALAAPPSEPPQVSLITEVHTEPSTLPSEAQPSVPPPDPVYSARNLVILNNFDSIFSTQTKSTSSEYSLLFPREKGSKPAKLPKYIPDLCAVTSKPAKYRDVTTGLVYADAYAYKKIQEAKQGRFKWSNMLGCYVGAEGVVAKGVPEGFLAPKTSASED